MNKSTKVPIRLYDIALGTKYKELAQKKDIKTCDSGNAKG